MKNGWSCVSASRLFANGQISDLADYKKTLIERFRNPAIRDQLSRIGIYGSSGIPKFVLPSIEHQLQRGGPIKLLSFIYELKEPE